jgi:hypothetical protein
MGISDNGAFNSNLANIASANYGPTATTNQANTQANTALVGQQTQAASMNNQITKASMPSILQAINEAGADQSGSNPGNPAAGQGKQAAGGNSTNADQSGSANDSWYNAGNLEDAVRNQNFVTPYTPQDLQSLKLAKAIGIADPARGKALYDMMMTQRTARIDNQTASNQLKMGNTYDAATSVATIDPTGKSPGATFSAFKATDPQDAAIIAKESTGTDGKFDPVIADQKAQQYSSHLAAVSHLYSGRDTDINNGQLIDKKTGQAVTGQAQLFTGSTSEQRGKDSDFANEMIDVPHQNGITTKEPRWSAPKPYGFGGTLTPAQYMLQQDKARRTQPGAANDSGGAPVTPAPTSPTSPTAAGRGNNGPVAPKGSGQAAAAALPYTPPASGPIPPSGTPAYAQRVTTALNDPEYKAPYNPNNLPSAAGTPQLGVKEKVDQYMAQRKDAQTEFSDHANSSAQALMNFNAAKAILNSDTSPLPTTGPIGAVLSKLSALGYTTDNANSRQEAAKYLTNAAVAQLKQTYGARPGVFDVKINVEKAFPSIENQGMPAVKNLIDSQITQAQYLKDSSQRGGAYIAKGGDPSRFNEWQEKYFPRANLVTPPAKTAPMDIASQKDPQAAYDALKPGDAYTHNGKTLYKGGT